MSINHLSGMSSTLYAGNTFFILCTPIWLNSLSHNVLIVYTYISIFQENTCSHSNSLEGKEWNQCRYLFNCNTTKIPLQLPKAGRYICFVLHVSIFSCSHCQPLSTAWISTYDSYSVSLSKGLAGNTLHLAMLISPCSHTSTTARENRKELQVGM